MRCSLLLLLFIAAQINETLLGVPELSARKKHRTEELEDEVKENAAEEDVDGGEVEYEYEYEYEEDENEDFDDDDEDDGDDDGDDEYYYYYYYYYDDEENVTSSELPSTSVDEEISTTPYYEYYEELPSDYDNNKKSTLKTPDIEEFLQVLVSTNPNEGVDVNEFFSETNSSSVITESSEPELEQILTEQPIISLAATKTTFPAAAEIKLTSPSYKTSSQSVVPRLTTSTSRKPLAAHILTEIKPNSTPAGSFIATKPMLISASTPKTITSAAPIQSVKPKTAITTTNTEKVTQANKATTQLKAQVAISVSTTRLISTSLAATVKTSTLSTKSSSTTKKIPATTSSTTTTSTSAPMDPALFKKNCHAKQFSKLLKCCEPAAKNLVPLASRDRSCKANPSLLNAFNSYSLNKLQYSKNLRTKNFKFRNSKIQKAMGKSACFVNCFLISNGAMTEDLLIKEEQLITFLTSMQNDQKWVSFISSAVSECLTLTSGFQVPSFSRASKKCDGTAYVATQCVLHKMIADCPNRVMTKQCYDSYLLFDKCSTPTLAFAFQLHDRKKRLKFSNKNKNG
ncbi:uncharacterized protein LOC132204385 isoform X1 [Neocloeon triangulifer]|uniref:uncharacterized protein LOC132204385 isoform X1 n=1 Tax=Neocloeon triangulifer TaxID=2078957 RepID=UPI00286F35C7|nr:uncharacterized protein LOC132204385 isoform X1 [Neocloeon triangulifer]